MMKARLAMISSISLVCLAGYAHAMESDAMDLEEIKDSPLTITLPPEVAGPEVVGEEGCCAGLNLRRFFSELTSRALRAVRGDLADDGRINLSNIGDYADIVRPTADAS